MQKEQKTMEKIDKKRWAVNHVLQILFAMEDEMFDLKTPIAEQEKYLQTVSALTEWTALLYRNHKKVEEKETKRFIA